MAYTTIDKPSDYFNTVLYSGNSSTNAITGVGHQPDLTWIKRRNSAEGHILIDSVRGVDKRLGSNVTSAESTVTYFTSFDTDGFTVNGTNVATNVSGGTFCAWNWLADNTSGSSNEDGSITSTVAANTTSGFSIVSYTGTGANDTVGHGLGVAPKMIIIKNRDDGTKSWVVGHQSIGFTKYLVLNNTDAEATSSVIFQDTDPTSTVFSLGTNTAVNQSTASTIAYCFAEKKGYSKFGSYTGNGSTDGPFIYTGFKPAFIITKASSRTSAWLMYDNKRNTFNLTDKKLLSNETGAENNSVDPAGVTALTNNIDIVSNGFKQRTDTGYNNQSGQTYIYMAFAENPFTTSTGIPTTAR